MRTTVDQTRSEKRVVSDFLEEVKEATEYIGGLIVENERLKFLLQKALELLDDRASDDHAVGFIQNVYVEFPDLKQYTTIEPEPYDRGKQENSELDREDIRFEGLHEESYDHSEFYDYDPSPYDGTYSED